MPLAALPSLFLHYFDTHFVDAATAGANGELAATEADLATRFAVLAAETVYVPAASYVESALCRSLVDAYQPLFADGVVQLIGGDPNIVAFAEALLGGVDDAPPWFPRLRSATTDIRGQWLRTDIGLLLDDLPQPGWDVERAWADVPDLLTQQPGTAFTPEYARPLLFGHHPLEGSNLVIARRVADVINASYFESFAHELGAGMVTNMVFLGSRINGDLRAQNLPYRELRAALRERGALDRIVTAAPELLLELRSDQQVAAALLTALGTAPPAIAQERLAFRISDTRPVLNAIHKAPSGVRGATTFHRSVGNLLEMLFPYSLGSVRKEVRIDEGRKRIDLWLPNLASGGVMAWIRRSFGASWIIVEVKNYRDDIANPEIDQLVGRFSPWHGRFGVIVCRRVRDRKLATARCRDVLHKAGGLILVLDIDDLEELARDPHDPGLADVGNGVLGRRILEVYQ